MDENQDESVDWLDCVSGIDTGKGVIYFCNEEYFEVPRKYGESVQDDNDSATDSQQTEHPHPNSHEAHGSQQASSQLTNIGIFQSYFPNGCFIYSLTAYNPMNQLKNIFVNQLQNQLLLEELADKLPGSKILNNFSYFLHRPYHFERGFTVLLPLDSPHPHEGIIFNLSLKYRQAAYFKCKIDLDGKISQKIVLLEDFPKEVDEKLVVVKRMSYHPAFLHWKNNSVFHSVDDVINILSKGLHIPGVKELLDIFQRFNHTSLPISNIGEENKPSYPIIALEGVANIGISKQGKKLSECLGAKLLHSPPSCMQHLRRHFEGQNQLLKSAFYFIGNFILSRQIAEFTKKSAVVIDRYWYSSAAFTIASEVGCGSANLPPRGHSVYDWPSDLQKPTTVVLLTAKGSTHGSRGGERGPTVNQMVHRTLHRMKTPVWIEVVGKSRGCSSDETITIISKLQDNRILPLSGHLHDPAELCPGVSAFQPQTKHDLTNLDKLETTQTMVGDNDDGEMPALILH